MIAGTVTLATAVVANSVQQSEAGSFSNLQSGGPLRCSATGFVAVAENGGGADRRRSLHSFVASEDDHSYDWTPSVFAFSICMMIMIIKSGSD